MQCLGAGMQGVVSRTLKHLLNTVGPVWARYGRGCIAGRAAAWPHAPGRAKLSVSHSEKLAMRLAPSRASSTSAGCQGSCSWLVWSGFLTERHAPHCARRTSISPTRNCQSGSGLIRWAWLEGPVHVQRPGCAMPRAPCLCNWEQPACLNRSCRSGSWLVCWACPLAA